MKWHSLQKRGSKFKIKTFNEIDSRSQSCNIFGVNVLTLFLQARPFWFRRETPIMEWHSLQKSELIYSKKFLGIGPGLCFWLICSEKNDYNTEARDKNVAEF